MFTQFTWLSEMLFVRIFLGLLYKVKRSAAFCGVHLSIFHDLVSVNDLFDGRFLMSVLYPTSA